MLASTNSPRSLFASTRPMFVRHRDTFTVQLCNNMFVNLSVKYRSSVFKKTVHILIYVTVDYGIYLVVSGVVRTYLSPGLIML